MVDFSLTDEQKNLRELAHDFAAREIRPFTDLAFVGSADPARCTELFAHEAAAVDQRTGVVYETEDPGGDQGGDDGDACARVRAIFQHQGSARHRADLAPRPIPRLHAAILARRGLAEDRVRQRTSPPAQVDSNDPRGRGRAVRWIHRPH